MRSQYNTKADLIMLSAFFLLTGSHARGDGKILAPVKVTPRETSVLLLPALDATADSAHMQAPRQLVIRHRAEYEFITRQFKVLGETMAAKVADAAPRMDLWDISKRTPVNLDLMATRAGADWVVNMIVQEAKLDSSTGEGFKVHTSVLIQVWDARRHGWLVDNSYIDQTVGSGSPVFVFKNSLDGAIKGSLAGLLSVHLQVVSVSHEDGVVDYLEGQTKPFVGDPPKPFSGLQADQ